MRLNTTSLFLILGGLATMFLVTRTRVAATAATSRVIETAARLGTSAQEVIIAAATGMTRGVRNNNPGNIKKNPANKWAGMASEQPDFTFVTFITPEYGYRALAILLRNYARQGYRSVTTIIARFAPGSENDTVAYIKHVAQLMGVKTTQLLDLSDEDTLFNLMKAIARHEQGRDAWPDTTIFSGIGLAGQGISLA